MKANITVLGGDGIGPEVTREGVRALQKVAQLFGHEFVLDERDRVMLAPMDPLAEMLGDPRPGRSALDKKRGAFA